MSQDMEDFPSTEKIRLSRAKIKAWLESLRSSWSGTSHPASPVAGQVCWRTDLSAYAYYNGSAWKKLIVALKTAYAVDALSSVTAIDGAALLDDGQFCLVMGRAASGDQLPTVLVWDADSSATHDGWSVWRPASGAASSGDGRFLRLAASPSQTFTSGDATPSIANGSHFVTAGSTAITDFDDAYEGQSFVVERGASDIVITHNASLIDCGSSITLTAGVPRVAFRHVGGVHKLIASGAVGVRTDAQNTFTNTQTFQAGAATTAVAMTYGSSGTPAAVDPTFGLTVAAATLYGTPGAGLADPLNVAFAGSAHLNAGTRGIACGLLAVAQNGGTWGPDSSLEAGSVPLFTSGLTTRGGAVFGAGIHVNATTMNGASAAGLEIDTILTATVVGRSNLIMVSTGSDTGAVTGTLTVNGGNTEPASCGLTMVAIGSGLGYNNLLMTYKPSGGAQPTPVAGKLWRAGGFTCAYGLDWRDLTCSDSFVRLNQGVAIKQGIGNGFGRVAGKYNIDAATHDHFHVTTNWDPHAGTVDTSSCGTAGIELRGTNSGSGRIDFLAGAVNTLPSSRMQITTAGVGIGVSPSGFLFQTVQSANADSQSMDNTHASFSNNVLNLRAARAANAAYVFLACQSSLGGSLDNEILLRGDGNAFADGSFTGGGADFAEMFEWQDGNPDGEDRAGVSVVLVPNVGVIRPATSDDRPEDIIGVVSANPTVIGDAAWNRWGAAFLTDAMGRYLWEGFQTVSWTGVENDGDPALVDVYHEIDVVFPLETVVDGKIVQQLVPRTIRKKIVDEFPVVDGAGAPVMVEEIVVESYTIPMRVEEPVLNDEGQPVLDETGAIVKTWVVYDQPKSREVKTGRLVQDTRSIPRQKFEQKTKRVDYNFALDEVPEGLVPPADARISSTDDKGAPLRRRKRNPDYDPEMLYKSRAERPEWDAIGLVGKLRLHDGQPVGDRWRKMREIEPGVSEWLVR